jgi:uncharacterized membrane protein YhaH (DUF805 family)
MHTIGVLLYIAIGIIVPGIPAFVVGQRRGVEAPGLAFVPVVGPVLVILWSIGRSGWLCLLGLVPLVNLVFDIWLIIVVPRTHGRSGWWTLAFIIPVVNLFAFYWYAFTLEPGANTA